MLQKIPGIIKEYSGEYLKRFRVMFEEIPGNIPEDFREC